jgi:hypothetical protein
MISEAMVCLVQTVDLSYTETNTISNWTKTRFYMTHVTYEFHRVRPKWFLSLQYVRCKPCSYLKSRLALYPNGPKRASIWASSPTSTIRCAKMISKAMVYLVQTVHLSCTETNTVSKRDRNELPFEPRHLGVPSVASKTISEPVVCMAQTMHLSCTETKSISKRTERRFYMTHVT